MVLLVRSPQTPSVPNASAAYPVVASSSPPPTSGAPWPQHERAGRGQRARAAAVRGDHVEAPALRRRAYRLRVVAEAPDGRRPRRLDGAHEPVADGDGDEPEPVGDLQPAPPPAVELAAGEHAADTVPTGGQRLDRRAEIHPLRPPATILRPVRLRRVRPVLGQIPPPHRDVAGAERRRADRAEEVVAAGERGEGVRRRVRLLPLVVAAGLRAIEVHEQRRRRRRQQRAHYRRGLRLGHGEGGQGVRRRRPQEEQHRQQEHEEAGTTMAMAARRRHRRAQREEARWEKKQGGRWVDMDMARHHHTS